MVFDTNLIIGHVRRLERLPAQAVIPMVVAGELEAFALKADWGYQKVTFLQTILDYELGSTGPGGQQVCLRVADRQSQSRKECSGLPAHQARLKGTKGERKIH